MPVNCRNKINKIQATSPEMTGTLDLQVNLLWPLDRNGG